MRILMHCYEFPPLGGGGAKAVFGLSKELVESGHEIHLVTMGFRGLAPTEQIYGIHVHRVPCIRTREFISYTPELASYIAAAIPFSLRLIKNNKFDFNHTHFVFPDGIISWILKMRTGLPYILTVHGSDVPGYNPDRFIGLHKVLSPLWRKVVESANYIVSPSQSVKALVQQQNPTAPITLIPYGQDLNKFPPNQQKQARILVVSRLFKRKGIQCFIQALAQLNGQYGHEIDIVGDGPYRSALENMARGSKMKIKFWGHLDNDSPQLKHLFGVSSIFVLPSESENFPVVLLEAMSAELAIITTRSTGCAEVVGEAGTLVNAGDVHAIMQALVELISNPEQCRMRGQQGRKRLESHFTWRAVANQYLELYKKHAAPI